MCFVDDVEDCRRTNTTVFRNLCTTQPTATIFRIHKCPAINTPYLELYLNVSSIYASNLGIDFYFASNILGQDYIARKYIWRHWQCLDVVDCKCFVNLVRKTASLRFCVGSSSRVLIIELCLLGVCILVTRLARHAGVNISEGSVALRCVFCPTVFRQTVRKLIYNLRDHDARRIRRGILDSSS